MSHYKGRSRRTVVTLHNGGMTHLFCLVWQIPSRPPQLPGGGYCILCGEEAGKSSPRPSSQTETSRLHATVLNADVLPAGASSPSHVAGMGMPGGGGGVRFLAGVAPARSGLIQWAEGDGGRHGGAGHRQPFVPEVLRRRRQSPVVVLQQVKTGFLPATHGEERPLFSGREPTSGHRTPTVWDRRFH